MGEKLGERPDRRGRRLFTAALVATLAIAAVGASQASALLGIGGGGGTLAAANLGLSTVDQRIEPDNTAGFRYLHTAAGEPYTVREDLASAQAGRDTRRTSLAYFGQLSDFQLADEESPARVEWLDPLSGALQLPFDAAWRPWEALEPQIDDAAIRQVDAFDTSPIADGTGAHRTMDFTLDTGDSADSMQLNETKWVRTLLEGGTLNPNSGIRKRYLANPLCPASYVPKASEAAGYTGIQDFNDYFEGIYPGFYDPNDPRGDFHNWPAFPGLMNRAQQAFSTPGLDVPSYVTFGNHDGLVQGNQAANGGFEAVATGCLKIMAPTFDPRNLADALGQLNPDTILNLRKTNPSAVALVPSDPDRQFVSKQQYKTVFQNGSQADGHGFDYIDPAQLSASKGAAGYYSWSPLPGFRYISLDTVSEGGIAGPSADGNIDYPQFQWLKTQLDAAQANDQLVVIFSHHAIPSLTSQVPDEAAPPCTVKDKHGHDRNPGCDVDPRVSIDPSIGTPDLGPQVEALLHQYPNFILWVAGHSHVNDVQAYPNPSGPGGFWSVRTAAEADWPQQPRLLEIFDNHDGTLSIFGTILDHASDAVSVPPGTPAAGLTTEQLASLGRTMSYNDPQVGAQQCTPGCGEGVAADRNVELLIDDPR